MVKRIVYLAVTGMVVLAAGQAGGAAPSKGTLTFTTPSGIVNPTDSVPVWLTLLLDPSYSLATDGSGNVTTGLTITDIQANLFAGLPGTVNPAGDSLVSNLIVGFGCSGTFTNSCTSGPPYDFTFNFDPASLITPINLNLAAGSSSDYLFGTFVPTGGIAPAGTYQFLFASVFIQVFDNNFLADPNDPTSGPLYIAAVPIANTADSNSIFTRDVVTGDPVPEPASDGLMLVGLGVLVGFVRRMA